MASASSTAKRATKGKQTGGVTEEQVLAVYEVIYIHQSCTSVSCALGMLSWIKKNPHQLTSAINPILKQRKKNFEKVRIRNKTYFNIDKRYTKQPLAAIGDGAYGVVCSAHDNVCPIPNQNVDHWSQFVLLRSAKNTERCSFAKPHSIIQLRFYTEKLQLRKLLMCLKIWLTQSVFFAKFCCWDTLGNTQTSLRYTMLQYPHQVFKTCLHRTCSLHNRASYPKRFVL